MISIKTLEFFIFQIVELIFIDRLYQGLNKKEKEQPGIEDKDQHGKGMFKELWDKIFGRFVFIFSLKLYNVDDLYLFSTVTR